MKRFLPLVLISLSASCVVLTPAAIAAEAPKHLIYLDPAKFIPSQILPSPATHGSPTEAFELETLHRLIAGASPARMAQAKEDSDDETPSLFDKVLGFNLKDRPATWKLLELVQSEADIAAGDSKVFFHRMRPYSADPGIPFCERKADPAKPEYRGYPSGHATLGYSTGWVLAHLMPAKADMILARTGLCAQPPILRRSLPQRYRSQPCHRHTRRHRSDGRSAPCRHGRRRPHRTGKAVTSSITGHIS
jgi:acid phosphatase (class A)